MIRIDTTGIPQLPAELLHEAHSAWERVKCGDGSFKDWNGWLTHPADITDEEI